VREIFLEGFVSQPRQNSTLGWRSRLAETVVSGGRKNWPTNDKAAVGGEIKWMARGSCELSNDKDADKRTVDKIGSD
jgi:hypothetical protein